MVFLQTEAYFLSSASTFFRATASFFLRNRCPFTPLLSIFPSCPTLNFRSHPNGSIPIPPFLTLPDVSNIPITLSPHVRKPWVCLVSAQLSVESSSGSTGLVCRFGLWSRRGPTVRKWPLLWFKLAMRQCNMALCWQLAEERAGRVGTERVAICKPHESEWQLILSPR